MKMENVWRRIETCWESKISLNRAWGVEGADKADIILIKSAWHPHVRGGLSMCVLLIAQARSVRCGARYSLFGGRSEDVV